MRMYLSTRNGTRRVEHGRQGAVSRLGSLRTNSWRHSELLVESAVVRNQLYNDGDRL
jgi:hypothetical protein